MAIYECRKNNENHIEISRESRESVVFGTEKVLDEILRVIWDEGKNIKIAFDGWYGIDWANILMPLERLCENIGISISSYHSSIIYKDNQELKKYKKTFITDDPAFGWENLDGTIGDIIDTDKVTKFRDMLSDKSYETNIMIAYGPGCAAEGLAESYDFIFYFDKLVQYVLLKMWDSTLEPFGYDKPDKDYFWKEYYYCDYHILLKHKLDIAGKMDFYIDALDSSDLKMLPRNAYDEIIRTLVDYPVKCIETYQGGPWGAYRFKQLEDIEELECNAWHTMTSPDLSMEVDFGGERMLNLPFILLMQYPEKIVGSYVAAKYPLLFPFQVGLDDGWFPEPMPRERTAMPMHNHPGIDYCKKHFNEIYGRYETYYIVEAYENGGSFMGYKDDCDLEEWERKCRESDNRHLIEDWQDYCKLWETKAGDLFLIPPGTVHGHGGNQMVLEMDTCPAVAGNEYSFFLHDFARNSWNDYEKSMTGEPMKMHLEHGFNNERWRRESYVKEKLKAQAQVVFSREDYCIERFSTIDEMPFHIERIHYYDRAEYTTEGKFTHVLTLTRGKRAMIRSLANPNLKAEIVRYHNAVIPASFGDYELVSLDGGFNTAVLIRLKNG
jgi:hypothetical protein